MDFVDRVDGEWRGVAGAAERSLDSYGLDLARLGLEIHIFCSIPNTIPELNRNTSLFKEAAGRVPSIFVVSCGK